MKEVLGTLLEVTGTGKQHGGPTVGSQDDADAGILLRLHGFGEVLKECFELADGKLGLGPIGENRRITRLKGTSPIEIDQGGSRIVQVLVLERTESIQYSGLLHRPTKSLVECARLLDL